MALGIHQDKVHSHLNYLLLPPIIDKDCATLCLNIAYYSLNMQIKHTFL